MKKLIVLVILLLIPLAYAIEECKPVIEPEDIPCLVTSNWNYTIPCSSHNATVFNSSGSNIENFTFIDFGTSGRCYFIWNITSSGSYIGNVDNGDSFNILVQVDNMQIGLIIAIGLLIVAMLWIAFKLEAEHGLLKIGMIFFSVILMGMIPAVFLINTMDSILHNLIMGFTVVFWLYVAGYIAYWVLKKFGIIASKK